MTCELMKNLISEKKLFRRNENESKNSIERAIDLVFCNDVALYQR